VLAVVAGLAYLAYDIALTRGVALPGGDLRMLAVLAYVATVLVGGSLATWLMVPLPLGSGSRPVRTAWSAALGLLAAVPICYLVIVTLVQVLKPLLAGL
jgi:hypothetical protein